MNSDHTIEQSDDFLRHVFAGQSDAQREFRNDVFRLNDYCRQHVGFKPSLLLTGEPGVGKSYTARAISAHSQWLIMPDDEKQRLYYRDGKVCLSPEPLIEKLLIGHRLATVLGPQLAGDLTASELFGHVKGAFTGADKKHAGVFGDESSKDIFLDEIADLSQLVQAQLLQVIEYRTFRPVGGLAKDECESSHRLMLATNKPLAKLVGENKFRRDLYDRIQGYQIKIPSLRDRRDSIIELVNSMLDAVNSRHRGPQGFRPQFPNEDFRYRKARPEDMPTEKDLVSNWITVLSDEDLEFCQTYEWPGNIRELKHRLDLYVFHEGKRRLRDVMPIRDLSEFALEHQSPVSNRIRAMVDEYLEAVRNEQTEPPEGPQQLLDHFMLQVKTAVYQYKESNRLTGADLKQMFPSTKDPGTVISRWKPNN